MKQVLKRGDVLGMSGKVHADLYNLFKHNSIFQENFSEGLRTFIVSGLESIGTWISWQKYFPEHIMELYSEFQKLDLSNIHVWNYSSYSTLQRILVENDGCTDTVADMIKGTIDILFQKYYVNMIIHHNQNVVHTVLYSDAKTA